MQGWLVECEMLDHKSLAETCLALTCVKNWHRTRYDENKDDGIFLKEGAFSWVQVVWTTNIFVHYQLK